MKIYTTCVIRSLPYPSETFHSIPQSYKTAEVKHPIWLRRMLSIKYQPLIPDIFVLQRPERNRFETIIILNQMRQTGHVARMEDVKNPRRFSTGICRPYVFVCILRVMSLMQY